MFPKFLAQRIHPHALARAAHQAGLQTRKNLNARARERLRLVKHLYRCGMDSQRVRNLFRLIGWLTKLPEDLELKFREELLEYEQTEKPMTIDTLLSPLEVILLQKERQKGVEEGRQEGRQEGILQARQAAIVDALETRFGVVSLEITQKVQALRDEPSLRNGLRAAVSSASLEDFLRSVSA